MKKILLSIFCLGLFAVGALSAETIVMKAGAKEFSLEVNDSVCAKDFVAFVAGKNIQMQKYGEFEFYVYQRLKTADEPQTAKYEKGKVYYNIMHKAISFAYADHDLGNVQAILIGSFKDEAACGFLAEAENRTAFSFVK